MRRDPRRSEDDATHFQVSLPGALGYRKPDGQARGPWEACLKPRLKASQILDEAAARRTVCQLRLPGCVVGVCERCRIGTDGGMAVRGVGWAGR